MANRNIRDFFPPMPKSKIPTSNIATSTTNTAMSTSAAVSTISPQHRPSDALARSIIATSVTKTPTTAISLLESPSTSTSTAETKSSTPEAFRLDSFSSIQGIVKSSDDEESDSDDSLDDPLAALFQTHSSNPLSPSLRPNNLMAPSNTTSHGMRRNVMLPPSPERPRYQFDMKRLISQAQKDKAMDASALRVEALMNESAAKRSKSGSGSPRDTQDDLLEIVAADEEDAQTDDILQAIKRTEATIVEKRCYFFDTANSIILNAWPSLENCNSEVWQQDLANTQMREQTVLSGFARDMVSLGDILPDELFLWMLDEICFESREDLRQAYCSIILVSKPQILRLMKAETITNVFQKIGATGNAVDLGQKVHSVPLRPSKYEGRNWTSLRIIIKFLGQISPHLSASAQAHGLCLLTRLCADRVILEDVGLLDAVQRSMNNFCQSIESVRWDQCCRDICASIYSSIQAATLQFQVIRCIPRTTPRLHVLRRKLALACFFEEIGYSTRTPEIMVDLWELTKRLGEPQFKISRDTDYHKLGAQISMLNVIVDNALSVEFELKDPEAEQEFNEEVDALTAQVRNMASSISDAGAAFISRIDAKEIIEGFRYRLLYAVRTKPVPKQSVFDTMPDKSEGIRKQSELMKKHFKLIEADAGR